MQFDRISIQQVNSRRFLPRAMIKSGFPLVQKVLYLVQNWLVYHYNFCVTIAPVDISQSGWYFIMLDLLLNNNYRCFSTSVVCITPLALGKPDSTEEVFRSDPAFNLISASSNIVLPARLQLLSLPRQCYQLGTKCSNNRACGGTFFFKPLNHMD